MASVAHCDTHVALWLYSGESDHFEKKAVEAIDRFDLKISPIVRLEMQFLFEIERITEKPDKIIGTLMSDFGVSFCEDSFGSVVDAAVSINWTRDPFDRLIVAHAAYHSASLITKDVQMRKHYKNCIW
ncbi:MAG: PIN domain-containing protein [Chitinispirillaceae bacterium]|nr:PIN domain-containing protein [Chitinispirillaceae bacterium]